MVTLQRTQNTLKYIIIWFTNDNVFQCDSSFFTRCVKEKEIKIVKVDSNECIGDIFTMALRKEKFTKFRELLNVK